MDRSHEGRFEIAGSDRLDLLHRISTNDLLTLDAGEGRPTLFTNAIARILDRATIYHRGERALVIAEPGRGEALRRYLQRNIFFNDDARLIDLASTTRQFVLHGARCRRGLAANSRRNSRRCTAPTSMIAGMPVVIAARQATERRALAADRAQ